MNECINAHLPVYKSIHAFIQYIHEYILMDKRTYLLTYANAS